MFVVFVKFVISWFSGWFMTETPEPEETISEKSAEDALDIATKREDENERKRNQKAKNKSGGIVDTNTKEESDRKKDIKKLAEIASEKNRILKEEIKKEEEFLSSESHKKLLEIAEKQSNDKRSNTKKIDSAISTIDTLKTKGKKTSIHDSLNRLL